LREMPLGIELSAKRIQKTLEDANIRLDSVVIDILGLSGRRMIEALIAGQAMPQALASLAHRRIHASTDKLGAALHGRITRRHRFLLKLHLDQIDEEVSANVSPFRAAVEMLSSTPGISTLLAEVIVAEMGIDMSTFRPQAI